jgi:threonine dehydratase
MWPIALDDVLAAQARIRPHLAPTPLLRHPLLDQAVGHGVHVLVKHENCQPTGAFKVRNALSALSAMTPDERARGVVTATRGNHGLGVAWAGRALGAPVTICVPHGNNVEKNDGIRALGAEIIEHGDDYDACLEEALRRVDEQDATMLHSTNDPRVLAGAGTMALEILERAPEVDAFVIAVGGGSQAVGAMTVARALARARPVYGVQAAGAAAAHDGYHAGHPVQKDRADTFADGLATRACYELTFEALRTGLEDFITVTETEIAEAVRLYLSTTHHLAEGAGAAGLAGLCKLATRLAGKTVAVILSGGNIDQPTLHRVVSGTL